MDWEVYPIREQIKIQNMYSLFEAHYDSGFEFLGESHSFWECLYVMGGEVRVSADGRIHNLSRGVLIVHKPEEFHKFVVTGQGGADVLVFSFDVEGSGACELKDKVFALSEFEKGIVESLLFYIRERMSEPGRPDRQYLYYLEPFHSIPTYSQVVAVYLQQLLLSFMERGTPCAASSFRDAVIFSRAVSYLNSNLHRQPTVAEVSRCCNISEAGMKRLFDRYAGIGVHKYLLKLKIRTAAELLRGGESVSQVAEKMGFSCQSYFSRAFKRETGASPSSLKQK